MKTALVYAQDERTLKEKLPKFLLDKDYLDYKILTFLADDATLQDVLEPKAVNKFVYDFVDAIFLLDKKNLDAAIPLFFSLGVEPRKIFLWNEQHTVEPLRFTQRDGTPVICFEGLEFHIKNSQDENFMKQTLGRMRNQKFLHNQPLENYPGFLKNLYRRWMVKELNLDNPKTYTEKINWLKLYDSTPLKSRLADKFSVRDYVADKIGEEYLIPLLGAWDSFDEINFDSLPNQFVLKCNHGSGMNIIVRDKNSLDMQRAREKINAWMATDFAMLFLELHYSPIKRKIIAEKYFEQLHGGLIDYKFHCFNGEPEVISVIGGRDPIKHTRFQEYHDFNWKDLGDWNFGDYNPFPNPLSKPTRLEDMIHFAKILSEKISYVRADFYEIEGQVYFGEMTFMPDAGFIPYRRTWTYERDLELGNMIKF